MFFRIVASLILAFILWSATTLFLNYVKARRIGLPIVISLWDAINPLWFAVKDSLYPTLMKLPFGLSSLFVRNQGHWTFIDRYSHHSRYGPAFTEVSPACVRIYIADPSTMEDYSKRRNDFIKPPEFYSTLEPYGPNLDTVNGKIWERHRKITVPPFNEKNSALVWQSTLAQATQMLRSWHAQDAVSSTSSDINVLALNVLFFAGFGQSYRFMDDRSKVAAASVDETARLGYRESLRVLLKEFVPMVIHTVLTQAGYPSKYMWGSMSIMTQAKAEFKTYMSELVANERTLYEQGNLNRHNLISTLIRADIEAKNNPSNEIDERTGTTTTTMKGLSEEELFGNLYIYNLAGHDTSSGTLHFAIIMLAINPELQDWIAEEIDAVRKVSRSSGDNDLFYESIFPKLLRCLAVTYETLRLYGPVQMMPRKTPSNTECPLWVDGRNYILPPSTYVTANFSAIHTNPQYWGPDPLTFRPDRFIAKEGTDNQPWHIGSETFKPISVPAAFVAWNFGPRLCPGRKFSQVEIVAALFVLFAEGSRVQITRRSAETQQQARERGMKYVQSATLEATLKLRGDIDITWTRK